MGKEVCVPEPESRWKALAVTEESVSLGSVNVRGFQSYCQQLTAG